MKLRPLRDSDIGDVARWLSAPECASWLRFGPGVEVLSPVALKVMSTRDTNVLRVFTTEHGTAPIGIVALSEVDYPFKTALLWYALGEPSYAGQGCTSRAVSHLLAEAFTTLGLHAVSAWVVDGNSASVRILERNHFRPAGRLRAFHRRDGCARDRLLFDRLATDERIDHHGSV